MNFLRILAAWLIFLSLPASATAKVLPPNLMPAATACIAYMLSHQLAVPALCPQITGRHCPGRLRPVPAADLIPGNAFCSRRTWNSSQPHANRIDDELRRGRAVLPDKGAELLNQRIAEVEDMTARSCWMPVLIPIGEDYLEFDPEKIKYAATMDELQDRWRRILKLQILETYLDFLEEQKNKSGEANGKEQQPAGRIPGR